MDIQKHKPEDAVDKLGGTIVHLCCSIGKLNVLTWYQNQYHLDLDKYNSDGYAPVHCAISGGHLFIL